MKFDTIVIGGGLAGLTTALKLQDGGQNVAVASFGQSTLHFGGGQLDLLGYDANGKVVEHPLQAIAELPARHPYHKVKNVEALAAEAQQLLSDVGFATVGSAEANHYRLTPMGVAKPAWLIEADMACLDEEGKAPAKWGKTVVVNIKGYLDWPVPFLLAGLKKLGVQAGYREITTPELENARKSPSEMRATSIARVLTTDERVRAVAQAVNDVDGGCDTVLLPAVLGYSNDHENALLKSLVKAQVVFVATLPPSVPGTRLQTLLRRRFIARGGTFLTGDKVVAAELRDCKVQSVNTAHLPDDALSADNYVLAAGSFQNHGIEANYQRVYEPLFGLDIDGPVKRTELTAPSAWQAQPYMECGVAADADLHPLKDGKPVANLWAAGAVLGGHNAIKLADGTGVDMLTALQVSHNILKK